MDLNQKLQKFLKKREYYYIFLSVVIYFFSLVPFFTNNAGLTTIIVIMLNFIIHFSNFMSEEWKNKKLLFKTLAILTVIMSVFFIGNWNGENILENIFVLVLSAISAMMIGLDTLTEGKG